MNMVTMVWKSVVERGAGGGRGHGNCIRVLHHSSTRVPAWRRFSNVKNDMLKGANLTARSSHLLTQAPCPRGIEDDSNHRREVLCRVPVERFRRR